MQVHPLGSAASLIEFCFWSCIVRPWLDLRPPMAGLGVAGLGQVVIGVDVAVSVRVEFVAVLPATLES